MLRNEVVTNHINTMRLLNYKCAKIQIKVEQEDRMVVFLKSMSSKYDDIAFYSWKIEFRNFKIGYFNPCPKGKNNDHAKEYSRGQELIVVKRKEKKITVQQNKEEYKLLNHLYYAKLGHIT